MVVRFLPNHRLTPYAWHILQLKLQKHLSCSEQTIILDETTFICFVSLQFSNTSNLKGCELYLANGKKNLHPTENSMLVNKVSGLRGRQGAIRRTERQCLKNSVRADGTVSLDLGNPLTAAEAAVTRESVKSVMNPAPLSLRPDTDTEAGRCGNQPPRKQYP